MIFLVGGNRPQRSMVVETTTVALLRPIRGVAVLRTREGIVLGVLRIVLVAVGVTVVQDAGTMVDRTFRSARIAGAGTMVSVSQLLEVVFLVASRVIFPGSVRHLGSRCLTLVWRSHLISSRDLRLHSL